MSAPGRYYPDMPARLPGETHSEYTDRLTGADGKNRRPYDHARRRQCSIGYHSECTDPWGLECECPCHLDSEAELRNAIWAILETPNTGADEKLLALRGFLRVTEVSSGKRR